MSGRIQKTWEKDKEKAKEPLPQNLAELKAADTCFKCREPWVPGHNKVCKGKQVYSVILVANDQGKEEVVVLEDGTASGDVEYHAQQLPTVQISLHALHGSPDPTKTFTLRLKIGNSMATTLIDTGSDISFINAKFVVKHKYKISKNTGVIVATANGQQMTSNTVHDFKQTFRLLDVKGYDVIFGADWLYTHNPVSLDLTKREFSICKDGKSLVTFADETIQSKNQIIGAKKLCHLLKKNAIGAVIILNNSSTPN